MAFISDKKRENIIKKINKSYGARKFLMILEMVLLIGFIIMTFVSLANGDMIWYISETKKLTTLGWGMFSWAIIMTVFGIITLILILTLKSPKDVTKEVSHLESSALSGKKIKRTETSVQVVKDRTTPKAKKLLKESKK